MTKDRHDDMDKKASPPEKERGEDARPQEDGGEARTEGEAPRAPSGEAMAIEQTQLAEEEHVPTRPIPKPRQPEERPTETTQVVSVGDAPPPPPPDEGQKGPLTGHLFEDKYKMGPLLGEGGMGVVYKATHVMMRKEVAIKLLHPHLMRHPDIVERFRREAESLARLDHPNIIKVLDFGRSQDGIFYLVMDFVPGIPLDKYLKDRGGRLPWREASQIIVEILKGLEAAHAQGIIHRDLKPENIILQPDKPAPDGAPFTLKILDFGIARLRQGEGPASQLTQSGMIFGTPSYLSPEQAQGKLDITPAVDIYATGIIYYLLVVGELPFRGNTHMEILQKHISQQPPVPRRRNPEIPRGISNVILKALRKKPERRFSSAREMREEIERYLHGGTTLFSTIQVLPAPLQDFLFYTRGGQIAIFLVFASLLSYVFAYFILQESENEKHIIAPTPRLGEIKKEEEKVQEEILKNFPKKELKKLSLEELYLREDSLESLIKKHPDDARLFKKLEEVRKEIVKREKKKIWDTLGTIGVERGTLEDLYTKLMKLKKWDKQDSEIRLQLAIVYSRLKRHKSALKELKNALLADPKLKKNSKVKQILTHYLLSTHLPAKYRYSVSRNTLDLIQLIYDKDDSKSLAFLADALQDALPRKKGDRLEIDPDIAYELYKFLLPRKALAGFDHKAFWATMLRNSTKCDVRVEASRWFVANATVDDYRMLRREMRRRYFYDSRGLKVSAYCYKKVLKEALDKIEDKLKKKRKKRKKK